MTEYTYGLLLATVVHFRLTVVLLLVLGRSRASRHALLLKEMEVLRH